jgi:hypothetical protein
VDPFSCSPSPDISSSDFPFDSGTKKVKIIPRKFITPRTIRVFLTPIPSAAYKNPNAPTIAPALPDAADIPWQVHLNFAGKISARTTAGLLPKERHEAMEQITISKSKMLQNKNDVLNN